MIAYFILLIGIIVWGGVIKPPVDSIIRKDYISRDKSNSIKGIFVLIVFFSHFFAYVKGFDLTVDEYLKAFITSYIGQLMVTMFLFYSGYGVMLSIKKKGMSYVKNLPIQRILKTLIMFDIAILGYAALKIATRYEFGVKQFLLTLVGWDSLGNSNWYIFCILCSYLLTFIAFFIVRKNYYLGASLLTVLTLAFVLIMSRLKQPYWYNTAICYTLGVWYALFKDKIEAFLNKRLAYYLLAFFGCFICFAATYVLNRIKSSFIIYELACVFFVMTVVLFTMRVSIDNKLLRLVGKNVFGLYILQRLPMAVFSHFSLISKNMYLCFAASIAITVGLTYIFNKISKLIDKPFKRLVIK